MEKTPHMLEIQHKFGKPLKKLLKEEFEKDGSIIGISRKLGVNVKTAREWLELFGIKSAVEQKAVKKCIKDFDHYLKHRKELEAFEPVINPKKNRFEIVYLATKQRPEIEKYQKEMIEIDGPRILFRIFDYFMKNRTDGNVFNRKYISKEYYKNEWWDNKKLEHAGIFVGTYDYEYVKERFKRFVEIVAQERPEIKIYIDIKKVARVEGPPLLIEIFDYFLEHRKEGDVFNTKCISQFNSEDREFRNKLGKRFENLESSILRETVNWHELINKIVELASKQRPEILEYWIDIRSRDVKTIADIYLGATPVVEKSKIVALKRGKTTNFDENSESLDSKMIFKVIKYWDNEINLDNLISIAYSIYKDKIKEKSSDQKLTMREILGSFEELEGDFYFNKRRGNYFRAFIKDYKEQKSDGDNKPKILAEVIKKAVINGELNPKHQKPNLTSFLIDYARRLK